MTTPRQTTAHCKRCLASFPLPLLSEAEPHRIASSLRAGQHIQAIQLLRQFASLDLRDAKAVETHITREWVIENIGITDDPITAAGEDGVARISRFAFNLGGSEPLHSYNPAQPDGGLPLISVDPVEGRIEVTFARRKPTMNPGITYTVQFSEDLENWTSSDNLVEARDLDSVWEEVRYVDSEANQNYRFCRVAVQLMP